MRIKSFEFSHIKAFRSVTFDLDRTSVIVGQNDHGKSSLLKAIDIVLNQIDEATIERGALHPDLADKLLPIFPVNAKARRVTINYECEKGLRQLHLTVRANLTFVIHEKIERGATTTKSALRVFAGIRATNRFVLIPAVRDASSQEFRQIFAELLREHGLDGFLPRGVGGTTREYRSLKNIRDKITSDITPFVHSALLPRIEESFGFETQHRLSLKFDVDVAGFGQWVLDNLQLGFDLTDDGQSKLALSEAGNGIQSGVLLALHRMRQALASEPDSQFILAIEEPEAFLHPQRQKELYGDILAGRHDGIRVVVTTHSPYIVAMTPFEQMGLVRRQQLHSALSVPKFDTSRDRDVLQYVCGEANSAMLFAEKVIFVEGESDERVIRALLDRQHGSKSHLISIISAGGNRSFSPLVRMLRSLEGARIPYLVVTDFDSLTSACDRALLRSATDSGCKPAFTALHQDIDEAAVAGEARMATVAAAAESALSNAGFSAFVFTADLEYALVTGESTEQVRTILAEVNPGVDYADFSVDQLRKSLGSKGAPMSANHAAKHKKPYIHEKIAKATAWEALHPDMVRLLNVIEDL